MACFDSVASSGAEIEAEHVCRIRVRGRVEIWP